ncbi:MAG TPA: carboxypeptidase-like regulatory domain-containing protein [Candidatus Sulfotelmatobacter sp.]|nr:carboxypeptidase-like regulatory domain-containing protein [Candidatus Sulfotelmatobacter sp.]
MTLFLALCFGGLEVGGVIASHDAASTAANLRASGDYGRAVSLDNDLAASGGPLRLLAGGDVDGAGSEAESTVLDWAAAESHAGRPENALALLDTVVAPDFVGRAQTERWSVLVESARRAADSGDYAGGVQLLDRLLASGPSPQVSAQVQGLRAAYELPAATQLVDARAADAVGFLDDVLQRQPDSEQARSLLPQALLNAGHQALDSQDHHGAATFLLRLVADFPSARQSTEARTLLNEPQRVSGTLATREGDPLPGASVRLSSHFRRVGRGYITSGPFFLSSADSGGDFSFASVPVGGPYVLEVLHRGQWTTFVDPVTQLPANSFTLDSLTPVDLTFVIVPA